MKDIAERRKLARERYAYRKAHKLCLRCGVPLDDGYSFLNCENCREKIKNSRKKTENKRKNGWISDGMTHGDSELTKEVRRVMERFPDMPPTAYGKMKAMESGFLKVEK